MQKRNYSGAFDTLRKRNLWAGKLSRKLRILKKNLKNKIKPRKLKQLNPERSKKAQLLNLRLAVELRKKMDAIKQKTNTND